MVRSEQSYLPWTLDREDVITLVSVYVVWCMFYSGKPSPWHEWLQKQLGKQVEW